MKRMNKIWFVLLACCIALGVVLTMVACGDDGNDNTPCQSHTDANKDGKCDVCGATVESEVCDDHIDTDGDNLCEICGAVCVPPLDCTFLLKDEKGNAMAGISLTMQGEEGMTVQGVTDADGKIAQTIVPGKYTVHFEGLAEGWYVEGNASAIEIAEGAVDFHFTAIDNNPDGSEEKPYYVGDESVSLTFPAGVTYNCFARGTSSRYLVVENANAKVSYDGRDYLPENGVIRILVAGAADTNSTMPFTVTNTAGGENTISIRFESLPGTQDNPFAAELDQTLTANVPAEGAIYYSFTAQSSGYLVLMCTTPDNNIMMYNTTTYVVTSYTDGGTCLYLPVNAGDSVSITVSSKGMDAVNEVVFHLKLHSGEESDPLYVFASGAVLRMEASSSLCLEARVQERVTVSIDVSAGLTVKVNGVEVEAAGGACIFEATMGTKITVVNPTGERTDVVLIAS